MQLPEIVYRREHPRPRIVYATYDIPESVRKQLPYRATVTWTYTANAHGLPSGRDLENVQSMEARIIELLTPQRAVFVGHTLEAGRIVAVFHAPTPVESTVTVRTGLAGKQTLDVTNHHDPEWEFYNASIAPCDLDIQMSRSRLQLDTLRRAGDRAELPRAVDFNFVFATAEGRTRAVEEAVTLGFRVSTLEERQGFFVELKKDVPIAGDAFVTLLSAACELARRHGGTFHGWGCPVVR